MNALLSLSEHLADRHQWYTVPRVVKTFHRRLAEAPWHDLDLKAATLAALRAAAAGPLDEKVWITRLAEQTIRQVVPRALRAAADLHPEAKHRAALRGAADRCCQDGSKAAAWAADAAADAAWAAAAAAGARAAARAADAAADAARAAAGAADAAAWAADAAWAAADAAWAWAWAAAADAAAVTPAAHDQILCLSVKIAIEALP